MHLTDVLTALLVWPVLSLVFMVALPCGRPYALSVGNLAGMPLVLMVALAGLFHALCFKPKQPRDWRHSWLKKAVALAAALYARFSRCRMVAGDRPDWRRVLYIGMYAPGPGGNWAGLQHARAGKRRKLMFVTFVVANTASFVVYNAIPLPFFQKFAVCLMAPFLVELALSQESREETRRATRKRAGQAASFVWKHVPHPHRGAVA